MSESKEEKSESGESAGESSSGEEFAADEGQGLAQSHGATEVTEEEESSASASDRESESDEESASESASASGGDSVHVHEDEDVHEDEAAAGDDSSEPDLGDIQDARPLKKGGEYPEADDRELRMAGAGCIGLVVAASLTIGLVFFVAFRSINDLGGGSATATVVSEAPPRESSEGRSEPESRPEPQVRWMQPGDGLELAEREGRPVVVFFEAVWAHASQDMRDGTFEDPSVVEAIAPFVPVRVDMAAEDPHSIALKNEYEISFVPHVLFLGPDQQPLRPGTGGMVTPEDLRVLLSDALAVHRERAVMPPEASESGGGEPTTTPATPASDERP